MGEDSVVCVDRLSSAESLQALEGSLAVRPPAGNSCSHTIDIEEDYEEHGSGGEDEPLIHNAECRICQEEDSVKNLEKPCACSGSLKFAHRACVQRWCNEKGNITCEICNQTYQPGYIVPPATHPEDTTIHVSGDWAIGGAPLDLHDPRLLAMAAAERHLIETDYDEYADSSASGAAFCRSAALILMALLLLRHALTIGNEGDDDDLSTFFSLFLLRAAGFLLPCYIMAWAISILQRRRQRQEAAAIAAAEVAFMLQAQQRGFHVTIAPVPPPAPEAESAATPVSATAQGPVTNAHPSPPQ